MKAKDALRGKEHAKKVKIPSISHLKGDHSFPNFTMLNARGAQSGE